MLKAIKIRLYPSDEQANYIARLLGTCRFVYNNLLAHKIEVYNTSKKTVTFGELGKKLVALKSEFEWIKDSHSKVLQQSLINLESAYKSFFKNGAGFPKFKCKHDPRQSCRFPLDAFMGVEGNRLTLIRPLKDIHFKCSKRDEKYLNKNQSGVRSATLSRTNTGKYFLSILVDGNFVPKQSVPKSDLVGIDLGIKDFIVASDGTRFSNLKVIRSNEKRLARLQRQLSRKQKGSANKNKARNRLAALHEKLNNQKEFYLHAVSNKLLDENQVVVMEGLNVKEMMARCKPQQDENGHFLPNGQAAKSGLNRAIQELSLFRFRSMLEYKAAWMGRDLIVIDRWFPSSKLCGECGSKNDGLTLSDREWVCSDCGVVHDRDLNAARNIAQKGRRLLSIKEKGRSASPIGPSSPDFKPVEMATSLSMKQEKNVSLGIKFKG